MSDLALSFTTPVPVDIEPWNKMPQETSKAYSAFISYRNVPIKERSLKRAVVEFYGIFTSAKLRQFQHWSAKNMWVDRAGAWDDYTERRVDEATLKAIEDMNKRHIQIAHGLLKVGLERLKDMQPIELDPSEVLRYLQESVKIERLALGEPDSIQKEISDQDTAELTLGEMTDDQLKHRIIQIKMTKGKK